jgi:DNA replication and repair protein RecF
MALDRLDLTDFRNHAAFSVRPEGRFIILHGANGAGKTNILEAVSLLVPGRGFRRANLHEMARQQGKGGFAVAARLGDSTIGTAVLAEQPGRRIVHINGVNAAINDLAEWLSILWLTPAMDRLFMDGAGARRRFLDRLVLALEPQHARNSSRYDNALRQRNRLLSEGQKDAAWFDAIEASMAESAAAIAESRARTVGQLSARLAAMLPSLFAKPLIALDDAATPDAAELAKMPGRATVRPGARWRGRIVTTSRCIMKGMASLLHPARPVNKRHCCSRLFSPMQNWWPNCAPRRPYCCLMKLPHIWTLKGAWPCSNAWQIAGAKSG